MNSGIGPARARDFYRLFEEFAQRLFEFAGHGSARRLHLETKERCAVIFDGTANGLRYTFTGWRFGTLRFSSRSKTSAHVVTSVRSGAT